MIEGIDPPIYLKEDYTGSWDTVSPELQKRVVHLCASFHRRDNNRHNDGSRGSVRATPKELLDFITFIISGEKRV